MGRWELLWVLWERLGVGRRCGPARRVLRIDKETRARLLKGRRPGRIRVCWDALVVMSGEKLRLSLRPKCDAESVIAVEDCRMNVGLDRHGEENGYDHDSRGQRYRDAPVNNHL